MKAKVKIGKDKPNGKMKGMGFRLPDDITNWLQIKSEKNHEPAAQIVRRILRKEMELETK